MTPVDKLKLTGDFGRPDWRIVAEIELIGASGHSTIHVSYR